MKEEEKRGREQEKRMKEEERRMKEEAQRKNAELERRIQSIQKELDAEKEKNQPHSIQSLDAVAKTLILGYSDPSKFTRNGNNITHSGTDSNETILDGRLTLFESYLHGCLFSTSLF